MTGKRRLTSPGAPVLHPLRALAGPGFVLVAAAVAAATPYPVVDTGQMACYDDHAQIPCPPAGQTFHGQDAQHVGAQPAYRDNGDGTVTDLVTGLMWQQDTGAKLTYDEALAGAASLDLAGHQDWRLPSIKELYSLILFSGVDPSGCETVEDCPGLVPFLDTDVFDFAYGDTTAGERVIDAQYISSTEYVGIALAEHSVFGVNFADGRIKGYPVDPMPSRPQGKTFFVRYVRGGDGYGVNDLVDNGDGTVTDRATRLTWARDDSGVGMNWQEALAWVAARNAERYLGHDDWRLPDAKELQSIVDYTRSPLTTDSAAIDPRFRATAIIDEGGERNWPCYWASTTHLSRMLGAEWGVYVCFGEALGWMEMPPGSGAFELLDVHGAGAQRSDAKAGDPDDWPYGHGPQGDVVRIDNYVRPVRTATTPPTYPTRIFWRHRSSGAAAAWQMEESNIADSCYLPTVADLTWEIQAAADPAATASSASWLVWRNTATGQNALWVLDGCRLVESRYLRTVTDRGWSITAMGDLDGDGTPELLWRHTGGADAVWFDWQDPAATRSAWLPTVADPSWKLVGARDFSGDHHADLLWRNTATGANAIWVLDSLRVERSLSLPAADRGWLVGGTADADADGNVDLLWRHQASGRDAVWYLDRTALRSWADLPSAPPAWRMVGPR